MSYDLDYYEEIIETQQFEIEFLNQELLDKEKVIQDQHDHLRSISEENSRNIDMIEYKNDLLDNSNSLIKQLNVELNSSNNKLVEQQKRIESLESLLLKIANENSFYTDIINNVLESKPDDIYFDTSSSNPNEDTIEPINPIDDLIDLTDNPSDLNDNSNSLTDDTYGSTPNSIHTYSSSDDE